MSDYLSKWLATSPVKLPTGRSIQLNPNPLTGLKAQNVWVDDDMEKAIMGKDELPAWLQTLNDRLQDDKNKLANVVIKLADEFNIEDWNLNRYSNNGVEIYHKRTGIGIDGGSVSAMVRLSNLSVVSFSIKMGGDGKQLSPLVAAINYLIINVVEGNLDKALALGEQGEFRLEEPKKQKEVATFEEELDHFNSMRNQKIAYKPPSDDGF